MVGASQNLVSLVPNSGNFRFLPAYLNRDNGRDDSDGSGGSELVEVTKSGELVGVTHPVSLSESHPEQQLE